MMRHGRWHTPEHAQDHDEVDTDPTLRGLLLPVAGLLVALGVVLWWGLS
jgi:hypothetical protein